MLVVALPELTVDEGRLREVCNRYGVARLDVFGSIGRGEAHPDSDVDILYELQSGARLGWRIEDLANELSAIFGRGVDLVSRNALNERLRDSVLSEARPLYAA
ncbi:MAG: nucleotidyltransferase family protein [Actinobacteria bacterium]|nr:nucleotidyltransferase family protein [Actinomycetota bacterium]